MNTPAHLIVGAAAFARPGAYKRNIAALVGAIFPDLSLYLLAGWALFIQDISPRIVFDELYYSPQWQQIFAIDNSFPLWGVIFALGIAIRKDWLVAFAGAALLHLALDFPLHNHDARMHFWPITDWVFYSPFSYWDRSNYGNVFSTVEIVLCLVLTVVLLRRFKSWIARILIVALMGLEVFPEIMWRLTFSA